MARTDLTVHREYCGQLRERFHVDDEGETRPYISLMSRCHQADSNSLVPRLMVRYLWRKHVREPLECQGVV
jgi:hypothetical protein